MIPLSRICNEPETCRKRNKDLDRNKKSILVNNFTFILILNAYILFRNIILNFFFLFLVIIIFLCIISHKNALLTDQERLLQGQRLSSAGHFDIYLYGAYLRVANNNIFLFICTIKYKK